MHRMLSTDFYYAEININFLVSRMILIRFDAKTSFSSSLEKLSVAFEETLNYRKERSMRTNLKIRKRYFS